MIIVSRHIGAVEFVAESLRLPHERFVINDGWVNFFHEMEEGRLMMLAAENGDEYHGIIPTRKIRWLQEASEEDCNGEIVYGNVPMNLAAVATQVVAIEFDRPPRGKELSFSDMWEAGARFVSYVVVKTEETRQEMFRRIRTNA